MKRVLSMLLIVLMIFSLGQVSYAKDVPPHILLNGEEITFTHAPYVVSGTTMVPVRELAEKLGWSVRFYEKDYFTDDGPYVELSNALAGDGKTMCFLLNENTLKIGYGVSMVKKAIPQKAIKKDGTTYIPLRPFAETAGYIIGYDADDYAVTLIKNITNFAKALNEKMPQDKNYVFSPLSIRLALAMAANGAEGATKDEIMAKCGIDDLAVFNQKTHDLMEEYSGISGATVNVANSIWLNSDYISGVNFAEDYQANLQQNYQAEVKTVTNKTAVSTINKWVSDKTFGKITQIMDNSDFLATLVNTTYFKEMWYKIFDEENTKEDVFTDKDKQEHSIDFMNMQTYMGYCEEDGIKMIRMPYRDCQISMYFALTDDPSVDLESCIPNMEVKEVIVSIPKFKTECDMLLNGILKQMGIKTAFSDNADFSHMIDKPMPVGNNLRITDVLHKTYIDVNENGTEAAAATALMMGAGAALDPPKPKEFKADHPFTYFIRDDKNGEILFMGQYGFVE